MYDICILYIFVYTSRPQSPPHHLRRPHPAQCPASHPYSADPSNHECHPYCFSVSCDGPQGVNSGGCTSRPDPNQYGGYGCGSLCFEAAEQAGKVHFKFKTTTYIPAISAIGACLPCCLPQELTIGSLLRCCFVCCVCEGL